MCSGFRSAVLTATFFTMRVRSPYVTVISAGAISDTRDQVQPSRRRDCHFDDTPCLSILKHLLKVEGDAAK